MDVQKIVDEVAARTQIRIDKDDPAFAMATLIDVACQKALDQIKTRLDTTLVEFEQSALKLQGRMAAVLVVEIQKKLVIPEPKPLEAAANPDAIWAEVPLFDITVVFLAGLLVGAVTSFWAS
jgi:hypothetical protein